jgi:hypothetical protein
MCMIIGCRYSVGVYRGTVEGVRGFVRCLDVFVVDCDGHNVFSVKRLRGSGAEPLLKLYNTKSEVDKFKK